MDLGVRALPVTCDVGDPESVNDLVETAIGFLGQVDILVNNAGTGGSAPIQRETLENWNRTFAVNVTSAFLSTKAVLPGMLVNGLGANHQCGICGRSQRCALHLSLLGVQTRDGRIDPLRGRRSRRARGYSQRDLPRLCRYRNDHGNPSSG